MAYPPSFTPHPTQCHTRVYTQKQTPAQRHARAQLTIGLNEATRALEKGQLALLLLCRYVCVRVGGGAFAMDHSHRARACSSMGRQCLKIIHHLSVPT
jgi:hypothetical protein